MCSWLEKYTQVVFRIENLNFTCKKPSDLSNSSYPTFLYKLSNAEKGKLQDDFEKLVFKNYHFNF